MCIVVAAMMIAVQSNFIVSLGMVGALSIVGFRIVLRKKGRKIKQIVNKLLA